MSGISEAAEALPETAEAEVPQWVAPLIEFKGVSKTYPNGTRALTDINLTIAPGEFVFVVGPSGAGKSTFTKLIMREEKPDSGSLAVCGYDLTKIKRREIPMLRRKMGIVFQDFRLIPGLNVFENVAFAKRVVGAGKKETRRSVARVLGLMNLKEKAHVYPRELSGGEQQRVGLARALVNKPSLLIADEPTGNIDPNLSYAVVELLREINSNGTTVIMVTHEHQLVREFNMRVVMLEDGRIMADNGGEARG